MPWAQKWISAVLIGYQTSGYFYEKVLLLIRVINASLMSHKRNAKFCLLALNGMLFVFSTMQPVLESTVAEESMKVQSYPTVLSGLFAAKILFKIELFGILVQEGFGWTNGGILRLLELFPLELTGEHQPVSVSSSGLYETFSRFPVVFWFLVPILFVISVIVFRKCGFKLSSFKLPARKINYIKL